MLMGKIHADETSDASPVEGTLVNEWHYYVNYYYYVSIEGEESYLSGPYLSALPVAAPIPLIVIRQMRLASLRPSPSTRNYTNTSTSTRKATKAHSKAKSK